ncbi:hypothetical protein ET495_13540 [Xylanimonas allomyrinae]|uniref:Uncharacterized protein n=1 Tax=Xylanimonas allomyrinae TaxID=2509459 RepID=A0A4P6EQF7_9MICO|nr:hypothetical protein [Xylanimonas allomyrinae]QAY64073.1 hypothetical protein ET495_13540 [Xylanimonas allomyrinae]
MTTAAVFFAGGQLVLDRRRRETEEDRASKHQASKLSAWAVSDRQSQPLAFGVVVSNRSDSTFHNVAVDAFIHHKQCTQISLTVLPPGEYFVELDQKNSADHRNWAWEYAVEQREHGRSLRAYTGTEGYSVLSIAFTDNLDQRWRADKHMVLRRVAS